MVVYARTPARFLRQLTGDLIVAAWVLFWLLAAGQVHELVGRLAAPGRALESAGRGFTRQLADAADTVSGVPVVGDSLGSAFEGLQGAGTALSDAGSAQQSAVGDLALLLAVLVGAMPIVLVLAWWLPRRISWMRRAGAARRLMAEGGADLFALRALTGQPVTRLRALGPDLVYRWQERDPVTVSRLAALELSSLGLPPPPTDR